MVKTSIMGGAVLAAAALVTPALAAQSTFVSPSQSLAFAVSVPSDPANDDLYFSLAFPTTLSWAAVGLGAHSMAGALILVVYPSAAGQNVTLSPRLGHGHSEPAPYPGLEVTTLTGATGVANGSTYVYSGVCHNCRAWGAGGSINASAGAQAMVFATGPPSSGGVGVSGSDGADAPLRLHREHGLFTMDMVQAQGVAGPAVLDWATTGASDGATLVGQPAEGMVDSFAIVHGLLMVLCFYIVMPVGVGLLRLGKWVRWHGVNQGIAVVLAIAGFVAAMQTSTYYNRTKGFGSAHQIVGLVVFTFVLVQFLLGYFHHRVLKKTGATTKMARAHVWLGRVSIPLGIFNGFLGFPLALDGVYDAGLGALLVVVVVAAVLARCCVGRRREGPARVQAKKVTDYVISRPLPVRNPGDTGPWPTGPVNRMGSASFR